MLINKGQIKRKNNQNLLQGATLYHKNEILEFFFLFEV